jgi:hypothetical protein
VHPREFHPKSSAVIKSMFGTFFNLAPEDIRKQKAKKK